VKPSPTPTPQPAAPGQVRTRLTDDDAYGLDWMQVTTSRVNFLIPTSWRLLNVTGDSTGVLTVNNNIIGIDTGGDPSVIIIIQPVSGETTVLIKGNPVRLRGPGPDGETIDPAQLAAAADIAGVDNEVVLALHHFVLSIDASLR
jgi:hypothetical protein